MRSRLLLLVLVGSLACSTSSQDKAAETTDAGGSSPLATYETTMDVARGGYRYQHLVFHLPRRWDDASGKARIEEHIDVAIPKGVSDDAPVFYVFGEEVAATEGALSAWITRHGDEAKMIYVQIEHRGYGNSLSDDEDQTVPDYVRIADVIEDTHAVAASLKRRFTGPWILEGASYSGGLALEYAGKYPKDLDAVIATSGVVRTKFLFNDYDPVSKRRFGDALYADVVRHRQNLAPKERFDSTWVDREFFETVMQGVSQYGRFTRSLSILKGLLSGADTPSVIHSLRQLDQSMAGGEASNKAAADAKTSLTRKEALTAKFTWRVYRWQQCTEVGLHIGTGDANTLFARGEDEFRAECKALFGDKGTPVSKPWQPIDNLPSIVKAKVRVLAVVGGNDPYRASQVDAPTDLVSAKDGDFSFTPTEYGSFVWTPTGFHAPEYDSPELAQKIIKEAKKAAQH